jgi:hypothetical protein
MRAIAPLPRILYFVRAASGVCYLCAAAQPLPVLFWLMTGLYCSVCYLCTQQSSSALHCVGADPVTFSVLPAELLRIQLFCFCAFCIPCFL